MKRVASLDFMRGLAAFSVAIPHFLVLRDVNSESVEIVSILAVEVFFTLSGFVLAPQILQCMDSGRLKDLWTFLVRRWMRTIPPFLVALFVVAVLTGQVFSADFARTMFYVQNLLGQHNAIDVFPIAWSLSIEEWFYVTFPVLVFGIYKLARRWIADVPLVTAIGFIVVITIIRTLFGDNANWGLEVRRVVVFRIDSIAYGFLLYLLMSRRAAQAAVLLETPWAAGLILLGTGTLAALVSAAIAFGDNELAKFAFPFAAAALGASAICFFCSLAPWFERHRLLAAFGDVMGKISYSVYLFHIIVAQVILRAVEAYPLLLQIGIFAAVLTGFCAVFFFYFERPILAARPNYTRAEAGVAEGLGQTRVVAG